MCLDSKNEMVEQKASTMFASTKGHLDTFKHMSAVSKEHTIHSSKEHIINFWRNWLIGLNDHPKNKEHTLICRNESYFHSRT